MSEGKGDWWMNIQSIIVINYLTINVYLLLLLLLYLLYLLFDCIKYLLYCICYICYFCVLNICYCSI